MPDAPTYWERPPRAELAAFVHCIWTYASPPDQIPQRIAPDGRPELIVHCRAPYIERGAHGDVEQPHVLFAGQITQPLTLVASQGAAVIGVRLHAYATRPFLGVNADTLSDQRIDLTAFHGARVATLQEAVRTPSDWRDAVDIVEDYVLARLQGARIDTEVRDTVEAMLAERAPPPAPLISERQWQRRFKAEVGMSPRMLQTVLRFRRVFDAIEHPETKGWVEAALVAGYFDQPQMARDFRRFLGCTAREWAADRSGVAKALTAPGAG